MRTITRQSLYDIWRTQHYFDTNDYNLISSYPGPISDMMQNDVALTISERVSPEYAACDVCCGGAWLPIKLLYYAPRCRWMVLLDSSANQLAIAKRNISRARVANLNIRYLIGTIEHLHLPRSIFDLFTWSFAVHLFPADIIQKTATKLWYSGATNSTLHILTFDRSDIGQSICDKYIRGYADIDRIRYYRIDQLNEIINSSGWKCASVRRFRAPYEYSSVDQVESLFFKRSYSTFALLDVLVGEKEVDMRIKEGIDKMRVHFGNGPVVFQQNSTLASYDRRALLRY